MPSFLFVKTAGHKLILITACNSGVCHPRCAFKLHGEVNSVKKKHNYKILLNDGVY